MIEHLLRDTNACVDRKEFIQGQEGRVSADVCMKIYQQAWLTDSDPRMLLIDKDRASKFTASDLV